MMQPMTEITPKKEIKGRFKPGQSGNPSGKPKGALNKSTRAIMEAANATGQAPPEIMLEAMHKAWDAGDIENATKYAALAAPYCHPKLQSVEHSGKDDSPVRLVVCWKGENEDEYPKPGDNRPYPMPLKTY